MTAQERGNVATVLRDILPAVFATLRLPTHKSICTGANRWKCERRSKQQRREPILSAVHSDPGELDFWNVLSCFQSSSHIILERGLGMRGAINPDPAVVIYGSREYRCAVRAVREFRELKLR
jgi:hypothetical protein